MQNTDMIKKVKINNLGIIDNFSFDGFQNVNLIIGENGTGKSFLLKALYTAMKTVEDHKRGEDVRTTADILSDRLRWCFQTDKLGDIVKKGSETPFLFEMYWNDDKFSYGFTKDATIKVPNVINEIEPLKSNSIFIPAKEVLSLFGIILKSREIDKVFGFDDTYYDLVKALRIPPQRGKNYSVFAQSRASLKDIIDGKVEYDENSNKWYYKKGNQKFSIGATSEGVKKIAILDRLLANGYLTKSSVIFIDELESALHPTAISEFLDIIDTIAFEMGIQIFIASHSYFVIKKLYLNALKRKSSIPCISMSKENGIQYYDLLDGMPDNSIINESVRLYEEEINEVLG
ncbi:AAA family ATPase [Eisenbergiella porci]|uniref:AAA family ATPase n=1 Tax=Eisenbergiella porci TaxID=2652274 RepID=UPI002A818AC1|nr:AAA family ATPase [Eisenbergiella porci]